MALLSDGQGLGRTADPVLLSEGSCDDPVGEAAWIGERLSRSEPPAVTWVVPAGFESYARVLHPAEEPGWG